MGINVLFFQNFRDHPDRRMPAFRMMTISTSDEAEIMPNGGRYDKEKSWPF